MSEEQPVKPKRKYHRRQAQMEPPIRVEVTYLSGKTVEFRAWRVVRSQVGIDLVCLPETPGFSAVRTIPLAGVRDILVEEPPQFDARLNPYPISPSPGPSFAPYGPQPTMEHTNPAIAARNRLKAVQKDGIVFSETVEGGRVAAGFSDERPA